MASLAKTSERIASHRSCISSSLSQKKNKPRTSLSFLIFQNLFTLIIFNNFHKTLVSRHNFFIARRLIVKCLPIAYALYERPMPKKKKKKIRTYSISSRRELPPTRYGAHAEKAARSSQPNLRQPKVYDPQIGTRALERGNRVRPNIRTPVISQRLLFFRFGYFFISISEEVNAHG